LICGEKKIFGSIGGHRGGETVVDHSRLFRKFGSSLGMGPADEDIRNKTEVAVGTAPLKTGPKRTRSAPRSVPPRSEDESRIDRSTAIGGLVGTDTERISVW
jgi:hypothetical protein